LSTPPIRQILCGNRTATDKELQMNPPTMAIDKTRVEAFTNQVVGQLAACYGGVMVRLGERLGLYACLHEAGPLTSAEVANRSGCAERYVREWLNSQVAAGFLVYRPEDSSYELPPEHGLVLGDADSPAYMASAFAVPSSMWLDEDKTAAAFRSGEGVAWGEHDERLFCGVASFYRNAYAAALVPEWLPSLDGTIAKLEAGARVADVGCGHGHSAILMAEAFPASTFVGFDVHEDSIAAARENAEAAGVADRVEFLLGSATDYSQRGFDLICFFDALHDMGDPIGAAARAREALAEGGQVMLVEPFAPGALEDSVGPVGQLYFSASTALCCAHAVSEGAKDALGAQAGEERLRTVFTEAGFEHWRRATETPFNLILEARG
jgi:SAM-dependent methyltransferase